MDREFQENSTWQSLRDPILLIMLLLILSSIIFFTQQEIVQKILAFGTGVATQLALIPKIFGKEKEQNQKSGSQINRANRYTISK